MRSFIVLGVFVSLACLLSTTAGLQPNEIKVQELRKQLLYPYPKEHLKKEIRNGNPLLIIEYNFAVPFFGYRFNYTWVSLFGVLQFSSGDDLQRYPLRFPNDKWPDKLDPTFIAPFFAHALIGRGDNAQAEEEKPPGVYFKAYGNIQVSKSQDDINLHEVIRRDIQEGIIGATDFDPKHVIIVTWKNITFGGSANPSITNTYQLMVATDEHRTYAIFNYQNITWTSSTVANGDKQHGTGGTAAFVGFNAGNGTRAFEYFPYSQNNKIVQLKNQGLTNNHPGRHIFRIDELVRSGNCDPYFVTQWSDALFLSPPNAQMLGGTIVNITGPCFEAGKGVRVRFHDQEVTCVYRAPNIATCVVPPIYAAGFVKVETVRVPGVRPFRGKLYIESPVLGSELVWVEDGQVLNSLDVQSVYLYWNNNSLHWAKDKTAYISLYGYKETVEGPQLEFIRLLNQTVNTGATLIDLSKFSNVEDGNKRNYTVGVIQVNTTYLPGNVSAVWSRPIPLGWYFSNQWQKQLGPNWPESKCNAWVKQDTALRSFDPSSLPACPCTVNEAKVDKGRFVSSYCDDQNCHGNRVLQCFVSAQPSYKGSGQLCCYSVEGKLVPDFDVNSVYTFSMRSHPFGHNPYHVSGTVPGLSHWYQDLVGYYTCCVWSNGNGTCSKFTSLRPSDDCTSYKRNNVSQVYGDPHFTTHDNLEYNFNGKGEFVLVNVPSNKSPLLDVQARFEPYIDHRRFVKRPGTQITAVAVQSNASDTVEIRHRPTSAKRSYKLDVLVNGEPVYFSKPENQLQTYRGVTVYTPPNIRNQSIVVVAFESGAGIEVINQLESIAVRIYLPQSYMNQIRGLMGNWSNDRSDDLVTIDGTIVPFNSDDMEVIHNEFGLKWMLQGLVGSESFPKSRFSYENGRSTGFYNDKSFRPVFEMNPDLPNNAGFDERDIEITCGVIAGACRYDYIVTENRDVARATEYFITKFREINSVSSPRLCPAIPPRPHMRLETLERSVGTRVRFECERGFVLNGATERICLPTLKWSPAPDEQESKCVKE